MPFFDDFPSVCATLVGDFDTELLKRLHHTDTLPACYLLYPEDALGEACEKNRGLLFRKEDEHTLGCVLYGFDQTEIRLAAGCAEDCIFEIMNFFNEPVIGFDLTDVRTVFGSATKFYGAISLPEILKMKDVYQKKAGVLLSLRLPPSAALGEVMEICDAVTEDTENEINFLWTCYFDDALEEPVLSFFVSEDPYSGAF